MTLQQLLLLCQPESFIDFEIAQCDVELGSQVQIPLTNFVSCSETFVVNLNCI